MAPPSSSRRLSSAASSPLSPWDDPPETSSRSMQVSSEDGLEQGLLDDYRYNGDGGDQSGRSDVEDDDESYDEAVECGCLPRRFILCLIRSASGAELLGGLLLLVFCLSLPNINGDDPRQPLPAETVQRVQFAALGLAALLWLKAFATLIGVRRRKSPQQQRQPVWTPRDRPPASCCRDCCTCVAAYGALLLSGLFGIAALLAASAQHQGDVPLFRELVPNSLQKSYFCALFVVICGALEACQHRWLQAIRIRRRRRRRLRGLIPEDGDEGDAATAAADASFASRPWWWQSPWSKAASANRTQTQPNNDVSLMTSNTDWADDAAWFAFLRRRRRWQRNHNDDNLRDDGSVDFASVQEEWASRSSEDPYWWSRDHNGNRRAAAGTAAAASGAADSDPDRDRMIGRDLSWADDNPAAGLPPPSGP